MQIFCIPTEEDKDTENQTHEVAPKSYWPSKSDDIIAQMDICEDMEQLKTLYAELVTHTKSAKQTAFFESVKEKNKKRILSLNVHTS
jgi:hypothetical protein